MEERAERVLLESWQELPVVEGEHEEQGTRARPAAPSGPPPGTKGPRIPAWLTP